MVKNKRYKEEIKFTILPKFISGKKSSGLDPNHKEILKRDYIWDILDTHMVKPKVKNPDDLLPKIKDLLKDNEYEIVSQFITWAYKSKLGIAAGNYHWATSMFYEMSKGNKINHIGLF